ncbi:N5-glutamine methyltransferase family protein [Blattabacterium cuenoti]|uniref:N5-glutamine methyltransferase family protein n=1 Tax=Blattabacterium cuenoti TaxID=1653831 RepID=UPI00163CA4AE|nr:HemK/PrmC family methyltransferase [Blattabacterium cuenoti]
MNINKYYQLFCKTLHSIYSEYRELENIFFLLTTHVFQCDKISIMLKLYHKEEIEDVIYHKLIRKLWELKKNRPIQYVINNSYFFGMNFFVNENVFIPRPETEELVYWIIKDHRYISDNKNIQIFDLGTGSGCIAITLKKFFKCSIVHAFDFSYKVILIAKQNSYMHNEQIMFRKIDILKNLIDTYVYNNKHNITIVVSNPPYIKFSEKKSLHPNIVQYEPFQALFVPDEDTFIFYKKIILWIKKQFDNEVYLYFEINSSIDLENIINFMKKHGISNIEIRKDCHGLLRMIRIIII